MSRWVFDLDGTLCRTNGMNYEDAEPDEAAIRKLLRMRERGAHISIDSARGSGSARDHFTMTRQQLERWGLELGRHFDVLRTGIKLPADYYVDDRAISVERWRNGRL